MHHIEWICFRVHIHVHTDQRLQPDKTTASTTTTFGKFVLLVQKWEGSRPPNNSESETLFCGKDHQVKFAEYSSLCKYIGTTDRKQNFCIITKIASDLYWLETAQLSSFIDRLGKVIIITIFLSFFRLVDCLIGSCFFPPIQNNSLSQKKNRKEVCPRTW
jgi:hypothetical protein